MKREAAVAGYFYPGKKEELIQMLNFLIPKTEDKKDAKGILVPHAGYIYSGDVAGKVYGSIKLPETFIILSPNHTGKGHDISIMNAGIWNTPLGDAIINTELANKIIDNYNEIKVDPKAHEREHAGEVQLPFIQFLKSDFSFVPICIKELEYEILNKIALAIWNAIEEFRKNVLLIASSDMTHFQPATIAEKMDQMAIEQMMQLKPRKLYQTVLENNISMCGFIPAVIMIIALKKMNCTKGELIAYSNSGEKTGDYDDVVSYAGMIFY
jgi:AmmeMemoRadiSam system protein B